MEAMHKQAASANAGDLWVLSAKMDVKMQFRRGGLLIYRYDTPIASPASAVVRRRAVRREPVRDPAGPCTLREEGRLYGLALLFRYQHLDDLVATL